MHAALYRGALFCTAAYLQVYRMLTLIVAHSLTHTHGLPRYSSTQRCTIEVLQSGWMVVYGTVPAIGSSTAWLDILGSGSDYFHLQTNDHLHGRALSVGQTLSWHWDSSSCVAPPLFVNWDACVNIPLQRLHRHIALPHLSSTLATAPFCGSRISRAVFCIFILNCTVDDHNCVFKLPLAS